MLRVSGDYVKPLFDKNVSRNFRVVFPDGERADLTNADIVQESVVLTESVCSESVFTFGCCERSMIEFETIGVGNIRGVRIRCYLEIDLSTLTAAEMSALQYRVSAGVEDGTVVDLASSDLGWPYYRIPYGAFWVDSCPRDHAQREKRKVTAYTADPSLVPPVEKVRLATFRPLKQEKFATLLPFLAGVSVGSQIRLLADDSSYGFNIVDSWGFQKDIGYTWANIQARAASASATFSSTADGHTYTVAVSGTYALMDCSEQKSLSQTAVMASVLAALELTGIDPGEAWSWYSGLFSGSGAPPEPAVAAHIRLPRTWLQPHIGYDQDDQYGPEDHSPIYWIPEAGTVYYMQDIGYPADKVNGFVRLMWDLTCTYSVDGAVQDVRTFLPSANLSAAIAAFKYSRAQEWVTTGTISNMGTHGAQIAATDSVEINGVKQVAFSDSYDPLACFSGELEIYAHQARVSRAGLPELVRLDNRNPSAVGLSSIESIFWDDGVIDSIGRVEYNALWQYQGIAPKVAETGTGGRSYYTMPDNEHLNLYNTNWDSTSPVVNYFIPYLERAEFTPYEAVIHDMPWIQPGDCLALATPDPDVPSLTSFVLTQKISGVQLLTHQISASGGDVIFEPTGTDLSVAVRCGKSGGSGSAGKSGSGDQFVVRTATSSAKSVNAGSAYDWIIPFSAFQSTGRPIAVAGYSLDGTGVSQFTIYRVLMDSDNSQFIVAARNRDSQARTLTATVNALFLE